MTKIVQTIENSKYWKFDKTDITHTLVSYRLSSLSRPGKMLNLIEVVIDLNGDFEYLWIKNFSPVESDLSKADAFKLIESICTLSFTIEKRRSLIHFIRKVPVIKVTLMNNQNLILYPKLGELKEARKTANLLETYIDFVTQNPR